MKTLKFLYQVLFITICISVGLAAYATTKSYHTQMKIKIICDIMYAILVVIPAGIGYWWMIYQLKEKQ